jgi:hypothetical protein
MLVLYLEGDAGGSLFEDCFTTLGDHPEVIEHGSDPTIREVEQSIVHTREVDTMGAHTNPTNQRGEGFKLLGSLELNSDGARDVGMSGSVCVDLHAAIVPYAMAMRKRKVVNIPRMSVA